MKENFKKIVLYFISLTIVLFLCFYEFPYYIDAPGGLSNINGKVKVENAYKAEGSINLTYVSELKGTAPLLLIALIHPDWDIVPKEELDIGTFNYDSWMKRQHILMKQSYSNAIKYAYEAANKDVTVEQEKCYVTYIFEEANTDLVVGDQIIKINDQEIKKCDDVRDIINSTESMKIDDIIVKNGNKEYIKSAVIKTIESQKVIGIEISTEYILKTNPKYKFEYDNEEFGPSGGLMISLAVYNSLVKDDITGGKIISGTGTLNLDGTVGEIGGIEYKIKGAVKKNADIFFAPSGENYETAMRLKKEKGYKINIVEVKTFDDALEYLYENVVKK